jgi:dihydropteroate synthase
MRPHFDWDLGSRHLKLGQRTLVMGVLNVTPDSFSDGGLYIDREKAIEHGLQLLADGADIVDVGGESTRPGAHVISSGEDWVEEGRAVPRARRAVSEQEELDRVVPVIAGLKKSRPDAVVSIDTYKSAVARSAVAAGAEIVNDVSALRWDSAMPATLAELKCAAVLMHMRGRPEEWRKLPPIENAIELVREELSTWVSAAVKAGISRERIALDPGFGFGKSFNENYPLLAGFHQFHKLGFPLLAGTSRKSFVGRTLAADGTDAPPSERLYGTLATETALVLAGAHIIRTHDVKACRDAVRVADAIVAAQAASKTGD